MILKDTIIALATPAGIGSISVIRISGKKAIHIITPFFKSATNKNLLKQKSQTIHLGEIIDLHKNQILDEVLVSIFKNPFSYTGENVVEISCHGSVFIQQKMIQLFLQNGCRMAESGEFTLRAFLNGKMDLSQAEAVADLISSNSENAHKIAMSQMRGGISNELKILRKELLDFTSLIELELDFSEEDISFADLDSFKNLLHKIITILKKLIDSFAFGNAIKNGIPVAIIGESNVGKSTLLNNLLEEERAIVSEIAGTTRDSIEDEIIIDGVLFRFIDTAGIRKTNDIIENIGIKKTYEKASNAQLILFLISADDFKNDKNKFQNSIKELKNKFPNKRILTLVNKIDTLKNLDFSNIKTSEIIGISAKENIGIATLKNELSNLINKGALSNNEVIVNNARHFESLTQALKSILEVKIAMENNISSDLFAIDIRNCLKHIGNIMGDYDMDKDILGNIFANFCIGK